jgi:hypothetical protein
MQYQKQSFTLPASNGKVSQAEWDRIFGLRSPLPCEKHKRKTHTDYEITVGLRNPDGSLRRPKKK